MKKLIIAAALLFLSVRMIQGAEHRISREQADKVMILTTVPAAAVYTGVSIHNFKLANHFSK